MEHQVITIDEPLYPERLRAIHDAPKQLYVLGDPAVLTGPIVAVVGARSCTDYGAHVARSFGIAFARSGIHVVSGLARGVDAWAHRGVLESTALYEAAHRQTGVGRTIGVLGCGIDHVYPAAHEALFRSIVALGGAIVSEYEPGVPPAPWRFPARNRIIAGLAQATVVVEARERSGSLITADMALEAGRDLYAVPGEITSGLSAGTNALLRQGAQVATSAQDVIEGSGIIR